MFFALLIIQVDIVNNRTSEGESCDSRSPLWFSIFLSYNLHVDDDQYVVIGNR